MRSALAPKLIALALVAAVAGCSQEKAKTTVTVMTRNLYLGADLTPIFDPTQPAATLPLRVQAAWDQVVATNFPARAKPLAKEISDADPDLVGLQEVSLWYTGPCPNPVAGCPLATTVAYDFLQSLLDELANLGKTYEVAASVDEFGAELPGTADGVTFTAYRYQDRDVILKRKGMETASVHTANFPTAHSLPVTVAGQTLYVTRGYAFLEAKKDDLWFRFATSHPEAYDLPAGSGLPADTVRYAQIVDLATALGTELPTVLVGDLNSDPLAGPTVERGYWYITSTSTGLGDTWRLVNGLPGGFSCCYDGDLLAGSLTERIDLVLARGIFRVESIGLVGTAIDATSGLYPSDHAGLVATLHLEEE